MNYYINFFFTLIVSFSQLYAQNCNLSGYASLVDSDHKEGIMIQLLDTTATKLLQFRTTDSTGYFKFNNVKKGFYKIYITQFGYKSIQVLEQCNQADIDLKNIQLTPLSINLEEISVIDKVYRMKKSGDTTIFNIKAFESGSEQSVSDIIMKIPGFSISGTQYFFQNKSIKKILIDGKDIADDDHIEFTDALHYNRIEDVRIIENYHDSFKPYKEKQENEIALDIKTKTKYKNKYQGTLSANWGYKNIYDILGTLINTRNKDAFRLVTGCSNTGKGFIEDNINSIVTDVENDILFNSSKHRLLSQMNTQLSNDLTETSNYFDLNNHYAKLAYDTKIAKKYRLKSSLVLRRLTGSQDILSSRQFFSDTSSLQNFSQLSNQNILTAFSDNYLSIAINPSTNFEVNIPISFKENILNTSEDGLFKNASYQNKNNHDINQFSVNPIYKFHKNFANGITLSLFGTNKYIINSNNLNIFSRDIIAGAFIFDTEESLFLSNQTSTYTAYNFNNHVRLRKKIENIDFQYNAAWEKNSENISNTSDYEFNSPFVGKEYLELTNLTHSLISTYDKKSFRLALGLLYAHSIFKGTLGDAKNIFLRPHVLIMYRINSKWNISTSYSTKLYQPSIIQVNSLRTLQGQLDIWEGGVDIQDIGMIETYNFSLFREFEIGEETTFFNMTFSINPKSKEIHPIYNFDSFFQVKSFQLLKKENQIRFYLFYSKKLKHWSFNLNLRADKSALIIEDNVIKDKTFTTNFVINYLKLKNIKISSGIDVRFSSRVNVFSEALNVYLRPRLSVEFNKNMLQGRIWYQLMYNKINNSKNYYHILNFEVSRKKLIKNFELNIKIYDILNIIPSRVSFTTFNSIFIQTDTYISFPGQILLGLKWYFSPKNLDVLD